MAIDWIEVNPAELHPYGDLRATLKEAVDLCVKPNDTGARIYPNWIYEIEPASMLGKTVAGMKATTGSSNGKVHCWTIGVNSAYTVVGQGDVPPYAGVPTKWEDRLTIDIWGIFTDTGLDAAQRQAENEAALISAFLWRNHIAIKEDSGGKYGRWTKLNFTNIQPSPFSDGSKNIVASGVMYVDVNTQLTQ